MRWLDQLLSSRREASANGSSRNTYTCCFCCHVKMGTVFIGVFSLLVDLLAITIAIAVSLYPDMIPQDLSAPRSSVYQTAEDGNNLPASNTSNSTADGAYRTSWSGCGDDRVIGMLWTMGSAMFTICLLYGAIKSRPRYMLPYFCLQVFDFCISCLTVIGYFSYDPNVKQWITSQKWFPFKQELMTLSNAWLTLVAALIAVTILWIKAYCISVVWMCYKYLLRHQTSIGQSSTVSMEPYDDESQHGTSQVDGQVFLPPKYEDVILLPATTDTSNAPPPYASLVASDQSDHTIENQSECTTVTSVANEMRAN